MYSEEILQLELNTNLPSVSLTTHDDVADAYGPHQDLLTDQYKASFSEYLQSPQVLEQYKGLFSVRLTGNTVDRMIYCEDPLTFDKGMGAALDLSLHRTFDHFYDLVSFMASHRSIIQEHIHQQTEAYAKQVFRILGSQFIQYFLASGIEQEKVLPRDLLCQHIENLIASKQLVIEDQEKWRLDLAAGKKSSELISINECIYKINRACDLSFYEASDIVLKDFAIFKSEMLTRFNNIKSELVALSKEMNVNHLQIMIDTIGTTINLLNEGKLVKPNDIEDFLLEEQTIHILDQRIKKDKPDYFGSPRVSGSYTTGYGFYLADYKQKIDASCLINQKIVRTVNYHGQTIPLTVYRQGNNNWFHTNHKEFPKIANLLEDIYADIIELLSSQQSLSTKQKQQVLDKTAKIHWLFANMMPYERGSAAIGHMIAAHLMSRAGIEFSRMKPGICIDIDSFLMPLDDFIKAYPNFFERVKL